MVLITQESKCKKAQRVKPKLCLCVCVCERERERENYRRSWVQEFEGGKVVKGSKEGPAGTY